MTPDQTIKLASQIYGTGRWTGPQLERLQRFAEMVRNAALDEAINACKEYAAIPKVDSGVPLAIANRIGLLK